MFRRINAVLGGGYTEKSTSLWMQWDSYSVISGDTLAVGQCQGR